MPDLLSIAVWRRGFTKHGQKMGWGLAALFGLGLVGGFGLSQYSGGGNQGRAGERPSDVIATVNGQPITRRAYEALSRQQGSQTPGNSFASSQGQLLNSLVMQAIVQQEAAKRHVRASDADIDRTVAQQKQEAIKSGALPKGASDADWDDWLQQNQGISESQFRDAVAKDLLTPALLDSMKARQNVTDQDAKNQSAEVKLQLAMVPMLAASPISTPQNGPAPLPEAAAKQKAESLLAQAKAGGDMAAIARANPADSYGGPRGKPEFRPEYQAPGGQAPNGVLGFGTDFDAAVHATPKGGFTGVYKTTGFQKGFVFAKVLDRRNNLPKNFDVKKTIDDIKQQKASQALQKLILADMNTAKVTWQDPSLRAYYDYAKFQQMEQQQIMAQFGQGDPATAPTAAQVAKQQAIGEGEIVALAKQDPNDATADLVAAQILQRKMNDRATTAAQKSGLRDQLITMDENALRSTEDRNVRFELAGYYRDKKQYDKAYSQYNEIKNLLDADAPYDLSSLQQSKSDRERLEAGFRGIDKTADANEQAKQIALLTTQIAAAQKKQAAAQKTASAT
ncbi:MAG TPA: SurA N-terminal domain-containing protein, partial [Chthonomonadales bacterium]|nr:SurA N-terminal domain-containing protein [Chthonomonadales bacterium]